MPRKVRYKNGKLQDVGGPDEYLTWDESMNLVWANNKDVLRKEVERIEKERCQ